MKFIRSPRLRAFLIAVLFAAGCASKESEPLKWYKGNLHTHSYWSDGDAFPEMILAWYKDHGYDFIALSDHNVIAEGEKWVRVPDSRIHEDGFKEYLNRMGDQWVVYRADSGRIDVKLKTYAEYREKFEDEKFLIIRSEEITDAFEGRPIHMNATNLQHLIPPQGGKSVADVMQRNIDAVLKQRAETGIPMFPHLNHPNFYYAVSLEDMMELKGEQFFEVYNGHPLVNNYGDESHPGTEEMWDRINAVYAKRGQTLLYGLATDDSHNYHQFGKAYSNAGRGWVMVQADSLSADNLIEAMEAGKFYATTGVTLSRMEFVDGTFHVEVESEPDVSYSIQFIGVRANETMPTVLQTIEGSAGKYTPPNDIVFVRGKVISDRAKENPFQDGDMEMAWTQPVMLR